ncbi:SET domain-containing protein-lysine N-methyltransferase [Streptomyces griseocarneus]|nr:SET domain-containing protein-lysine N-methyltransferase [Streptomyces griseocarneus]
MVLRIVDRPGTGRGLITEVPFREGDVVARIHGHVYRTHPTRTTIQAAVGRHIDDLRALSCINHSCDPSTHVDVTALTVTAVRDLVAGDELTYFYPSTEWAMAVPFDCACAGEKCLGRIDGAWRVPTAVLARYRLNAHIRELAAARDAADLL